MMVHDWPDVDPEQCDLIGGIESLVCQTYGMVQAFFFDLNIPVFFASAVSISLLSAPLSSLA